MGVEKVSIKQKKSYCERRAYSHHILPTTHLKNNMTQTKSCISLKKKRSYISVLYFSIFFLNRFLKSLMRNIPMIN